MSLRNFIAAVLSLILISVAIQPASAKRRLGIPFIGGVRTEHIVKVQDLPDIPVLQREDGTFVDLGYKFSATGSGEWIGYIGSSRSYLPLTEPQLYLLLAAGGLKELPPVPQRPAGSLVTTVLFGIGIVAILLKFLFPLLMRIMRGAGRSQRSASSVEANNLAAAQQAMLAAAAVHGSATGPSQVPQQPAFGQTQPVFVQAQPAFGQARPAFGQGQPAFGQRRTSFGQR